MNTSLATAIKDKGDSELAAEIPGGFWSEERPSPEPASPYCVMRWHLKGRIERSFDGKWLEYPQVQFDVYANGVATVCSSMDALNSAFDDQAITLGTGQCLKAWRMHTPIITTIGRDGANNHTFRSTVTYEFTIQPD